MRNVTRKSESRLAQSLAVALGMLWFWFGGVSPARAQVGPRVQEADVGSRLLSAEQGRSIVNAAWQEETSQGVRDCSHFVHQVYQDAGFEYAYASSFEIYTGNEDFARVKFPRAGDLIVWPGHVGIVVNSLEHSFYSLVRTGLEEQDYEGAYWRSRGRPRFFRYRVKGSGEVLSATNTSVSTTASKHSKPRFVGPIPEERTVAQNSSSNRPPAAISERATANDASTDPPVSTEVSEAFEVPTSVIIATRNTAPTREELAEGISELSDAAGSALRTVDPFKGQMPLVIVEQFIVERVDIKRDHGWARLQVESKVLISGGAAQLKRRREKVRWELRRTESGWEAVPPADRTYVPHDVAVKNLAAQLAQLTASDGAAEHQTAVLRQEAQLASLLSALLETK